MLIQKDKVKGNIGSNYRPVTCVPLVWKLLRGIVADVIYDYLEKKILLPEEPNGCRRKCEGTADLLFTDKVTVREVQMIKNP